MPGNEQQDLSLVLTVARNVMGKWSDGKLSTDDAEKFAESLWNQLMDATGLYATDLRAVRQILNVIDVLGGN